MAQNIDAEFDLSYNVAIEDTGLIDTSTTTPHAEVHETGDGTADFYSLTLTAGNEYWLDIDRGWASDIDNGSCTSTSQVYIYMVLYASEKLTSNVGFALEKFSLLLKPKPHPGPY